MGKFKKININAGTSVYCIFGNPARHSLSPAMQNAAFAASGINAVYVAFEVEDIKSGIFAMKNLNISGASVTIPFKQDAVNHVDVLDKNAERISAVNTLCNRDGKIYGYNTDGAGAVSALTSSGITLKGSKILILGNGGSARSISFGLLEQGADVAIAGRNPDKILPLVNDLKKTADVKYFLFNELDPGMMRDIDIIINTTSVGMMPDADKSPLNNGLIMKKHVVFDIIYAPNTTSLLYDALRKGCRIVRGADMLLYQGAAQFEIWTGQNAPVHAMKKVLKRYIK